jgi:hypothetical protein
MQPILLGQEMRQSRESLAHELKQISGTAFVDIISWLRRDQNGDGGIR